MFRPITSLGQAYHIFVQANQISIQACHISVRTSPQSAHACHISVRTSPKSVQACHISVDANLASIKYCHTAISANDILVQISDMFQASHMIRPITSQFGPITSVLMPMIFLF
jgi:hypothetical protein